MKVLLVVLALVCCATAENVIKITHEDKSNALEFAFQFFDFKAADHRLNDTQHAILYAIMNCEEAANSKCASLELYTAHVLANATSDGNPCSEHMKACQDIETCFTERSQCNVDDVDPAVRNALMKKWDCTNIDILNLFFINGFSTPTVLRVRICNQLNRLVKKEKEMEAYWKRVSEIGIFRAMLEWTGSVIYYLLLPVFNEGREILRAFFGYPSYLSN